MTLGDALVFIILIPLAVAFLFAMFAVLLCYSLCLAHQIMDFIRGYATQYRNICERFADLLNG